MRILIAEDDPLLADGLQRALRHAGYATDSVKDGKSADSALSTQQFDLLILDIAVGVASILAVNTPRQRAPTQVHVPCHHLNYFVCEAGQLALKSVAW